MQVGMKPPHMALEGKIGALFVPIGIEVRFDKNGPYCWSSVFLTNQQSIIKVQDGTSC